MSRSDINVSEISNKLLQLEKTVKGHDKLRLSFEDETKSSFIQLENNFVKFRKNFENKIKGVVYQLERQHTWHVPVQGKESKKKQFKFLPEIGTEEDWMNMKMQHDDASTVWKMLKKMPDNANQKTIETWKNKNRIAFQLFVENFPKDNAEGVPLFDPDAQYEEWEDEKTHQKYCGMRHSETQMPHGIARCVSADGNNILEASYVEGEEQGLSILFANNTVHVYLNLRGQNGQLAQ